MHEAHTSSQSANSPVPFFSRKYSKFRAINPDAGYKFQDCPGGDEVADLPECIAYSVRERHRHGQSVTGVTGCHTRAEAMGSSRRAALAAIAIEKIVLAILRRVEECGQPCQEKADKGKQETYA
jgi:hypothetical protein